MKILERVKQVYINNLSDDGLSYLSKRGISEKSAREFELGFHSKYVLEDNLTDAEKRVAKAISETLFFDYIKEDMPEPESRIIYPLYKNEFGITQLVGFHSRSIDDESPFRHKKLTGLGYGIFNEPVLDGLTRVILCEGQNDCIILNQEGFSAIGLLGANQYKKEYVDSLLYYGVKEVYMIFDADENGAGNKGARRASSIISEQDITCYIVPLPRLKGDSTDVTDLYLFDKLQFKDNIRRAIGNATKYVKQVVPLEKRSKINRKILEVPIHEIYDFPQILQSKVSSKCMLPGHKDGVGSFRYNMDRNIFNCFGCLEESELIWTMNGLSKIKNVKIGDLVLDKFGNYQKIIGVDKKTSNKLLGISTAAIRKDPLILTEDHECIFVKKEDAIKNLPYLFERTDKDGLRIYGSIKKKFTYLKNSFLKFSEGPASLLKTGDYFAYPFIEERQNYILHNNSAVSKEGSRGPKRFIVNSLPANKDCSRLYGYYLSEGSVTSNGRNVNFSLHRKEANTIGKDIKNILFNKFGLKSNIHFPKSRPNSCEVTCSNITLADQLVFWFGAGSKNKKIPSEILRWEPTLQKEMLLGYRLGDAVSGTKLSKSVSQKLSYGLFLLSIQAMENPSMRFYYTYTDKMGLNHANCWALNSRSRDGILGFYERINGRLYYLTPITRIETMNELYNVVDIAVENTSSFLTKMGVVHNCGRGGGVVQFCMFYKDMTREEAIKYLEGKI